MATSARESALRVAKRLDAVGFSDIVVIRNKVMELRAAGQPVHAFHGGEPFFETPDAIKQALYAATEEHKTRYAPSSGIEPLRAALVCRSARFWTAARSARMSSVLMTSMSRTGSTVPAT